MMPASPCTGSTMKAAVFGRDRRLERGRRRRTARWRKPGVNGPKPSRYCGFAGEADDGRGAAGEVAGGDDDLGLPGRHALDLVGPLARRLDRRLDRLGAGVHRQRAVHAGERAERARGRGRGASVWKARLVTARRLRLLGERAHQRRVGRGRSSPPSTPTSCRGSAGRRCRTARRPRRAASDDRQRVVVARAVAALELDRRAGLRWRGPGPGRRWSWRLLRDCRRTLAARTTKCAC